MRRMKKILPALVTVALLATAGSAEAYKGTDYYFTAGSTMKIVGH
jgi:hypothetical protein